MLLAKKFRDFRSVIPAGSLGNILADVAVGSFRRARS